MLDIHLFQTLKCLFFSPSLNSFFLFWFFLIISCISPLTLFCSSTFSIFYIFLSGNSAMIFHPVIAYSLSLSKTTFSNSFSFEKFTVNVWSRSISISLKYMWWIHNNSSENSLTLKLIRPENYLTLKFIRPWNYLTINLVGSEYFWFLIFWILNFFVFW